VGHQPTLALWRSALFGAERGKAGVAPRPLRRAGAGTRIGVKTRPEVPPDEK
jgi:hypothetical protein